MWFMLLAGVVGIVQPLGMTAFAADDPTVALQSMALKKQGWRDDLCWRWEWRKGAYR